MSLKNVVDSVSEQYEEIKQGLTSLPYFEAWEENVIGECCRLASIVEYCPEEVVVGCDRRSFEMTYFILDGICVIVQSFEIQTKNSPNSALKNLNVFGSVERQIEISPNSCAKPSKLEPTKTSSALGNKLNKNKGRLAEDNLSPKKVGNKRKREKGGHEIKPVSNVSGSRNERKKCREVNQSMKGTNMKSAFVRTGFLLKKSCFNLEKLESNCFIISSTKVKCLRIPRTFLFQHSCCNNWNRISLFYKLYFPKEKEILELLESKRKWKKVIKEQSIKVVSLKKIPNPTSLTKVPVSLRLFNPEWTNIFFTF